jgi:hypothetical protein
MSRKGKANKVDASGSAGDAGATSAPRQPLDAGAGKASEKGRTKAPSGKGLPASAGTTDLMGRPIARKRPGSATGPTPRVSKADKARIERLRQLAIDIAREATGPGMVLICNPTTEPPPLAKSELLYDRCRWCETDIYYDRLMPSPPDITRVCTACGLLLLEAQKKGGN